LTLLLDSSALVTALTPDQPGHEPALRSLLAEPERLVISPFVLAEVDYFLGKYGGPLQALRFLEEVGAGRYPLALFSNEDVAAATAIVDRYRDQGIGLADASIVVLAARFETNRVFTLDKRHFRALRTPGGEPFTILPADA
jgi:predicted nucleic acid-binding protein